MTVPSRLPVVLMWHMHQPQYRDTLTGQYVLPWTYLHAIKDYTDMAAHLEARPGARAVVNFTPILLEQLEELAQRVGRHLSHGDPLPDPVLALLGPAPLPEDGAARAELLRACLRAQRQNLIERFAPYRELAAIAEPLATPERAAYASDALIRDLAVWYHIAWMGEAVRRSDVRLAALSERGRGFTAAQRRELLGIVGELLAGIIPRFRRLADEGRCELSVTPYAHPILPLLIDFRAAREAIPDSPLPRHASYPGGAERAAWHVAESIRVFERCFGRRPVGCWPSEGAVSVPALQLLETQGFRWAASGGSVLRASLAASSARADDPESLNRPYRLAQGAMRCFFRDDRLSDLIGFTYATWHGDDAARNLVHELEQIARAGEAGRAGCAGRAVLIALDGENAWEHYPFNGYYFLDALYAALASHPELELTTLSACVARGLEPRPLVRVVAGSWVHGTLATWMGDPAKNAAWDLLCDAKAAYDETTAGNALSAERREAAHRQLALCESSDWFWWFGDYNPAEAVRQFDDLYRRQLRNLYRLLDRPAPPALSRPISAGGGEMEHGGVMRRASA
jgi:alpha-amylase/alpha-mannosidase (GH57 family)